MGSTLLQPLHPKMWCLHSTLCKCNPVHPLCQFRLRSNQHSAWCAHTSQLQQRKWDCTHSSMHPFWKRHGPILHQNHHPPNQLEHHRTFVLFFHAAPREKVSKNKGICNRDVSIMFHNLDCHPWWIWMCINAFYRVLLSVYSNAVPTDWTNSCLSWFPSKMQSFVQCCEMVDPCNPPGLPWRTLTCLNSATEGNLECGQLMQCRWTRHFGSRIRKNTPAFVLGLGL